MMKSERQKRGKDSQKGAEIVCDEKCLKGEEPSFPAPLRLNEWTSHLFSPSIFGVSLKKVEKDGEERNASKMV